MEAEGLQNVFDSAFAGISRARESFKPQLTPREVGTITGIATGIAKVSGLPGVGFEELVQFQGDVLGIAFNVDADEIGVVLLGEYWRLHTGDEVRRTGRVMDVAVGEELLGRVIDPLGRPLDGNGPTAASERLPIERPAPESLRRSRCRQGLWSPCRGAGKHHHHPWHALSAEPRGGAAGRGRYPRCGRDTRHHRGDRRQAAHRP